MNVYTFYFSRVDHGFMELTAFSLTATNYLTAMVALRPIVPEGWMLRYITKFNGYQFETWEANKKYYT